MKIYEKSSSLDDLIEKTLSSLNSISSTKTIFGESIKLVDGTEVIPISKVTVGFVVGGGEYADLSTRRVATHYPMAGASGGGVALNPIGFLISTNSEVKYISTESVNNCEKILEIMKLASEKLYNYINKKEAKKSDNKR